MPRFSDSLKLSADDWERLISRLDIVAKCTGDVADKGKSDRRDDPRLPFRRYGLPMVVMKDGKSSERNIVGSRNLSSGGIGLVHGGFVHAGTAVEVYLPLREGTWLHRTGAIVFCRHLTNRLHELGCQFDEPISVDLFIDKETSGRAEYGCDQVELKDRRVLILTSEHHATEVVDHLSEAGALTYTAASLDDVASMSREHGVELILLDHQMVRGDPGPAIARLRAERYHDMIAVFGIEKLTDPEFSAQRWDVDMVFADDVKLDVLIEGLAWVLHRPISLQEMA